MPYFTNTITFRYSLILLGFITLAACGVDQLALPNSEPVANAGANQEPKLGDTVTLDGSASSDVDSDGLTFHWSFLLVPPGSVAKLSDTAAVNPSFTIDVLGDYVVQLIVDDGTVNSSPDTVTVSTN
jgi:predicted small lipoprotein YifL